MKMTKGAENNKIKALAQDSIVSRKRLAASQAYPSSNTENAPTDELATHEFTLLAQRKDVLENAYGNTTIPLKQITYNQQIWSGQPR
uniref:Uncharacterized protein MANES_16G130200 n=2 Tax=Rhizophora mucronata TaxID=61149 RepID=A0A2P2KSY5_RHIMU